MEKQITEYRGVDELVFSKVISDTKESFVTGEVKPLVAIAEIERTTNSSADEHYYNNIPAIVISSVGADDVKIKSAAIPLEPLAETTGQYYDDDTGMFIEGNREPGYFSIGYKTKKTDGSEMYVWRLKGTFDIPSSTHVTEDSGTTANGQELNFKGIQTTHKFEKTGKGAKAVVVDTSLQKTEVSEFFDTVQTPDTIIPSV